MTKKHTLVFGLELAIIGSTFAVATQLLLYHVDVIAKAQNVHIPMLATVSSLEQQKEVLQAQVELTELEVLARTEQAKEQVQAYVTNTNVELERGIQVLEAFTETYTKADKLTLQSPIHTKRSNGKTVVQFEADIHTDALTALRDIIEVSGFYTVFDALSEADRQLLIERTEAESPQAITELEDFFATPLLEYGQHTEASIAALLRSFSGKQFSSILSSVASKSSLATIQRIADSTLVDELQKRDVWPYPFMTIADYTEIYSSVNDWQTVSITIILGTL